MKLLRSLTAIVAFSTGANLFGATAFFSEAGFGDGATVGNPTINKTIADSPFELHIYFVPDKSDAAFVGISLGVTSSTAGVADLSSFSVLNPDVLVGATDVDDRWNSTGGSLVGTEEITNLSGVSVDKAGLDAANDGLATFRDAGYDTSASAFYFGKVELDPVGLGTTELSLSVGSIGIARVGDQPQPTGPTVSLTFGGSEPTTVLGDDIGGTGTVADATINVIPEPSTALLAGAGLFFCVLCRRRRN